MLLLLLEAAAAAVAKDINLCLPGAQQQSCYRRSNLPTSIHDVCNAAYVVYMVQLQGRT
jgi:hypothetical protein